jgi:hypothetical protein
MMIIVENGYEKMKDMMLYHTKHLEENNGYEKR